MLLFQLQFLYFIDMSSPSELPFPSESSPVLPPRPVPLTCRACGVWGHKAQSCPLWASRCFRCGLSGHLSKSCTRPDTRVKTTLSSLMAEVRALRKELHTEKWAWRSLRQRRQPVEEDVGCARHSPPPQSPPPPPLPPTPACTTPCALSSPLGPSAPSTPTAQIVRSKRNRSPLASPSPPPARPPSAAEVIVTASPLRDDAVHKPTSVARALVLEPDVDAAAPAVHTCALPATHTWDATLGRSRKKYGQLSAMAPAFVPAANPKRPRGTPLSTPDRPPPSLRPGTLEHWVKKKIS